MSAGFSFEVRKILALTLPQISISPKLYSPALTVTILAAGLGLAWLPLTIAVPLVASTIYFIWVLLRPTLGLYLLIIIIPFSSLLSTSVGGFKVGLMEAILALSVLAWTLRLLASQSLPNSSAAIKGGPLFWLFILILGAAGLSWLNTLSIGASMVETAKWVEMLLVYLLIINLLPAREIKWVVLVILIVGLSQAILGLYQFVFKVGPPGFELFGGRFLRAHGTFAQPNPFAGYLGLVLPLTLSLTIWGLTQMPKSVTDRWPLLSERDFVRFSQAGRAILRSSYLIIGTLLMSLPFVILLAALFASQSRGAWLGFAIASAVTLIIRSKKAAVILITLALIAGFIALIGSIEISPSQTDDSGIYGSYRVVTQRFSEALSVTTVTDVATTPLTDANFATIERLAHWQAAREMWRDNPWLGVGIGNYAVVYPAYAVGRWLDPLGHAHNYLLNIGAETGLIGITAYIIFWFFAFGLLWVTVRRSSGFYKAIAAGAVGVMVHLHTHNLVDNLYVQGMYLHIAVILGLVAIIYQRRNATRAYQ